MADKKRPETVSELYPRLWVRADDLTKPIQVTITGAELQDFRMPDGKYKTAVLLSFRNATRRMILNKTQCRSLMSLTGSERFADWVSVTVVLSRATSENGRPTIHVGPAATGGTEGLAGV